MAYLKKFIQLTWGGSYFGEDIWVNGLHLIDLGGTGVLDIEGMYDMTNLQGIAERISAAHSNPLGNSSSAMLEWVKMAVIGTDGKYTRDPLIVDLTPVAGGRTAAMYPQLATAVSLRTAKKRGPSAYGRYYAPVALPVESSGRIANDTASQFLTIQRNLITGINTEIVENTVEVDVVVGNVSKVGAGSQDAITGVFVGDLVDTQRRRRNKLNENYVGLTV